MSCLMSETVLWLSVLHRRSHFRQWNFRVNEFVSEYLAHYVGLFGAGVYLASYAALQLSVLRGQSYAYALLNILAAGSVTFSLTTAFNMSSLVIQVSWIMISVVGIARLLILTRLVRFTAEEEAFLTRQMPNLRRHLARRLLNCGVWRTLDGGARLTTEGDTVAALFYIHEGAVSVEIKGHRVGQSGQGTYIGELTLLAGGPATATVEAEVPVRVLSFAVPELISVLRRNTEIQTALVASFSENTKDKLLQRNHETIAIARASPG